MRSFFANLRLPNVAASCPTALSLALLSLAISAQSAAAGVVIDGSDLLTDADVTWLEQQLGEGPLTLTNIFDKASGDDSYDFHAAADNKDRTFVLYEVLANSITNVNFDNVTPNNLRQIIGGYNPRSWSSINNYNFSPTNAQRTAFLFNLSGSPNRVIQRQNLIAENLNNNGYYQTYNASSYGPTFGVGHDIYVGTNLTYGDTLNNSYGGTSFRDNILNEPGIFHSGNNMFGAIEVFTIRNGVPDPGIATPEAGSLIAWTLLGTSFGMAAWRRRVKRASPAA